MSDIEALRALVRKRRAAVSGKERRILNTTGIEIAGTREDPRRPPSVVKKYNTTQLNNYLSELNAFMMRGNGYVPDSSGGFIRKSDWLSYKRSERKFNKIVAAHFEQIGDIKDITRGVTIREAEKLFVPESKRAAGELRHRPYNEVNRNPKNIKSAEALKKLQDQIEGKSTPAFLAKALDAGRKQAGQMMDNAGVSELKEALSHLNNQQFDVLWNYWGFAHRLGQIGSSGGQRSKNVDRHDPLDAQEKDNIREDIGTFIDEASKLKFDKKKNLILDSKGPKQSKKKRNESDNQQIRAAYNKINKITPPEK